MTISKYCVRVVPVVAIAAGAAFVLATLNSRAADQVRPAANHLAAASSASSGAGTSALNLGKQATAAQGELAGVEGYTKYAAEVTGVGPNDWSMWGGSSIRNNTPLAKNIPAQWTPGEFDADTGAWKNKGAQNIKWVAPLGFKSYGNPVVANGHIYVGTNNGHAYLKRYAADVDLGVLLCFDEKTGEFLWQDSNEKLPTGRVNDWPDEGVCSAPLVEGNRLWYVSNRGELRCLSTDGLRGGKNVGPMTNEKELALKKNPKAEWEEDKEADVIWVLDMMKQLGVQQHNMSNCSVVAAGDVLFVNTGNGVDEAHINLPAPYAPTFIAVDKNTGQVIWTDNSPGPNVLHGQWSSPTYAVINGGPQAILGCGDGWVYSFDPRTIGGEPKLLWKFDCNPKKSKYTLDRADRNHIIATPVVYNGSVYIAVGEDPEHGEGSGHLWCIDPNKRGDVSPELVFNKADPNTPIKHKRNQAAADADGDFTRPNPNSAAVWHYEGADLNKNGKLEPEETMHRTCGTVAIKDDILVVADFCGIIHCLDAKTGKCHWTHDMLAASWASPLITDGKIYLGNEDGSMLVFKFGATKELISKDADGNPGGIDMGSSIYSTPIVANGVLYISTRNLLFAIAAPGK